MAPSAFVAALALAGVYAIGHRLRAGEMRHRRRWLSAGAGASTAYVFVDLLPELSARQRAFVEAAGGDLLFAEQRLYVLALAGFVVLYGLDHMVLARHTDPRAAHERPGRVYWLHVSGHMAYSWLIGYLLAERAAEGPATLVLYTAAVAFHFLIVDHTLQHEHGPAYEGLGRWLLAASVLAGCLVAAVTHLSEAALARLFAFVAGGVVITGATAELPGERDGRFGAFCAGAAAYTALLLLAGWEWGR